MDFKISDENEEFIALMARIVRAIRSNDRRSTLEIQAECKELGFMYSYSPGLDKVQIFIKGIQPLIFDCTKYEDKLLENRGNE